VRQRSLYEISKHNAADYNNMKHLGGGGHAVARVAEGGEEAAVLGGGGGAGGPRPQVSIAVGSQARRHGFSQWGGEVRWGFVFLRFTSSVDVMRSCKGGLSIDNFPVEAPPVLVLCTSIDTVCP
jgi:hypothetical protein